MKVDLNELRVQIRAMKRWHPLFGVLKQELSKLGYWKNRARGDPVKAHAARKRKDFT